MEPLGASWNTFNAKMLVEESEFIAQLLCAYPFPSEPDQDPSLGIPSVFCSNYDLDAYHSSDNAASCISLFAPHSDYEGYYIGDSSVVQAMETSCMPMDVCVSEEEINPSSLHNVLRHQFENHTCLNEVTSSDNQGKLSLKRRFHTGKFDKPTVPEDEMPNERPNKKTRDSIQVQRSLKNATKKTQKSTKSGDDEESNAGFNSQRSSCYSSEDNSNASQELNGGSGASSSSLRSASLNLNGKKKAIRASATNPQSLYARVDISTMLEETVQYVKFLQLQIKLLSSDELWMYSPIAYNGMNIGLA